jgi:hypothetical protein
VPDEGINIFLFLPTTDKEGEKKNKLKEALQEQKEDIKHNQLMTMLNKIRATSPFTSHAGGG